ncbi:MAG: ATP-binding protein [Bacteroidota bacterium]
MKIRTQYILFVVIVHLTLLVLSFLIFQDNKIWFIISEFFILGSILLSIRLYRSLIAPIQTITAGTEAIKDRDFNVKFLKTGNAEMDQLVGTYNQMIDQLRSEGIKQQEQHFFLDKLIQTSPVGIVILDFDENISSINPKAQSLLDLEEKSWQGQPLTALNHPIMPILQALKTGESKTVRPNGVQTFKCQKAHFVDRGFHHHFITLEELTVEILAAEKKAYGKVIRMMAHEVNNSIGAINSILESVLNYKKQLNEADQSDYENALTVAIERNDRLNYFMRNFADVIRLPEPNFEQYDLNQLIQSVLVLFHAQAGQRHIQLIFTKTDQPFWVRMDVPQMEQVLVNITKNAIEAIDKNGKVEYVLDTENKTLVVRDSGRGIPKDIESQLFTAFFSTKKTGQGIGLTLIRDILRNHEFVFSLRTVEPQRTEFRIRFSSND